MEVDNLPSYNRLNIVSPYGAALDDEPPKINFTSKDQSRQPHPSQRKFAQARITGFGFPTRSKFFLSIYPTHVMNIC